MWLRQDPKNICVVHCVVSRPVSGLPVTPWSHLFIWLPVTLRLSAQRPALGSCLQNPWPPVGMNILVWARVLAALHRAKLPALWASAGAGLVCGGQGRAQGR